MDRISGLPDDVLTRILSFLTTKEAAVTSVLAKRWRFMFASVTNLDIDDSIFPDPEEGERDMEGVVESFMDFVDRVLALQGNSPIEKFTLRCHTGVDRHRVDRWICNVLARGVSYLDLFMNFGDLHQLPQEIYVSKTLVELKVASGSHIDWCPKDIYLPRLKSLLVGTGGSQEFQTLLPACPALEKLIISDMNWVDSKVIVSSSTLKGLKIDLHACAHSLPLETISFDAPSLTTFTYRDALRDDYPQVNLENLVEADIDIILTPLQFIALQHAREFPFFANDVFPGLGNMWKLFSGIRHVEELYVSPDTLELLSLCPGVMPVFNNLKGLCVTTEIYRGLKSVPVLLQNCPHLEALSIQGIIVQGLQHSFPVKKLEIHEFKGTRKEFEAIKDMPEYFPSLKEIEIYAEENSPTLFEDPKVSQLVAEMLEPNSKLSSCDIRFLPPLTE